MEIRFRVVGAAICAVMLAASSAEAQPTRYRDPNVFAEVVKHADIKYGEAVNSEGQLQELHLDIYEPAGDTDTSRPIYIWAHGSAFTSMTVNKGNSVGPIIEYTKSGWVTASIDYRKRPNLPCCATEYVTNPDGVPNGFAAARDAAHDMQAAVRFVRANAETYGVDPDRIAVGGMSAGGIMALMTAFNEDDPGESGTPGVSSRVAAAIGHAASYLPVAQADPYGIRPGSPPIAVFHGLDDTTVPFEAAMLPCMTTRAMQNVCEFALYSDRGHELLGTREAQLFLYRQLVQE